MIITQPDRQLLKEFVSSHAQKFSGTVLDIGGGPKRYEHLFTHCKYIRLDIDPSTKPDIIASAEKIPLEDSSVDGIICCQVLGDVWDVTKAIEEMVRVAKPGAPLLITESLFNEEHDEPNDYWRFTQFAWKKLLEDTCIIKTLEPRGGFHSQIAQQKIRYLIEKYSLYQRPFLGRLMHIYATLRTHFALWRDTYTHRVSKKFPIGYCVLAIKK